MTTLYLHFLPWCSLLVGQMHLSECYLRSYSHPVDTWADSDCNHQHKFTASLAVYGQLVLGLILSNVHVTWWLHATNDSRVREQCWPKGGKNTVQPHHQGEFQHDISRIQITQLCSLVVESMQMKALWNSLCMVEVLTHSKAIWISLEVVLSEETQLIVVQESEWVVAIWSVLETVVLKVTQPGSLVVELKHMTAL